MNHPSVRGEKIDAILYRVFQDASWQKPSQGGARAPAESFSILARSLFSRVCERSVALLQGAYVSRDYEFELAEEFTDIREMKFRALCN